MFKSKSRFAHRLTLGSLLFGLFFGAGNLIFPISIGQESGSMMNVASVAFIISGVGLAALAVVYVAKSKACSLETLLKPYGSKYARFFNIALLLTIGPLFALPRTATVPYEVGVVTLFSGINHQFGLLIYSLLFFLITLSISLKPNMIKDIIGKFINPVFLTCLFVFTIFFFSNSMGAVGNIEPDLLYQANAFLPAFEVGYQTMDVLAALVFAFVVINSNNFDENSSIKDKVLDVVYAALITTILMSVIYVVLTYVGASSRNVFGIADNGGIALGLIFKYYFGSMGTVFLSLTITLACLKTSTGLVVAFSNYFSTIFPRFSYRQLVYFTTAFGYVVSNFGLTAIINYAVPVLNFLYPLAIMHVLVGLVFKDPSKVFLKSVLYFTMIASIFEVLKGLPNVIASNALLESLSTMYSSLPLAQFGIAWLNFTVVGMIVGYILTKVNGKQSKLVIERN